MKEIQKKKNAEKLERKEKVVTSGGPTMHMEDPVQVKRKF